MTSCKFDPKLTPSPICHNKMTVTPSWIVPQNYWTHSTPLFHLAKHSPSRLASRSNPRPPFFNCMRNDVTSASVSLSTFHTKQLYTTHIERAKLARKSFGGWGSGLAAILKPAAPHVRSVTRGKNLFKLIIQMVRLVTWLVSLDRFMNKQLIIYVTSSMAGSEHLIQEADPHHHKACNRSSDVG